MTHWYVGNPFGHASWLSSFAWRNRILGEPGGLR